MSVDEVRKQLAKPKSARQRKFYAERAPKYIENTKTQCIMRSKSSPIITQFLRDLVMLIIYFIFLSLII